MGTPKYCVTQSDNKERGYRQSQGSTVVSYFIARVNKLHTYKASFTFILSCLSLIGLSNITAFIAF